MVEVHVGIDRNECGLIGLGYGVLGMSAVGLRGIGGVVRIPVLW